MINPGAALRGLGLDLRGLEAAREHGSQAAGSVSRDETWPPLEGDCIFARRETGTNRGELAGFHELFSSTMLRLHHRRLIRSLKEASLIESDRALAKKKRFRWKSATPSRAEAARRIPPISRRDALV